MRVTGSKSSNAGRWSWKKEAVEPSGQSKDRYSTKASTKIAYWDNGFHWKDVLFVEEVLYQNKFGEYFLYCYGGASTRFAKINEKHLRSSADKVIPLTEKEAVNWLAERLGEESRSLIEGEAEPEEPAEHLVSYHLPGETIEMIQKLANARNTTPEAVIVEGIRLLQTGE